MTTTPSLQGPSQAPLSAIKEAAPRRQLPIYFWALSALCLLLLYNAIFSPGFFHLSIENGRLVGSLVNIFHYGAQVMLLSLGMTLVIATGGIDLSVGAIMAISAGTVAILLTTDNVAGQGQVVPYPVYLAIILGLLAGILAGCWNGALIGFFGIQPIIATLILMISGRGVAQLITSSQAPRIPPSSFQQISPGLFMGIPFSITLTIIMAALALYLARGTALGMYIESIGNNSAAAEIAGIHTRLVKFAVYGFTGLCAGLAGMMHAANVNVGDVQQTGQDIELKAIVAVAIGGTSLVGGRFSLVGALLGALTMQTLETTIYGSRLKPEYNLVVQAIVVVGICLLQSPSARVYLKRLYQRPDRPARLATASPEQASKDQS